MWGYWRLVNLWWSKLIYIYIYIYIYNNIYFLYKLIKFYPKCVKIEINNYNTGSDLLISKPIEIK